MSPGAAVADRLLAKHGRAAEPPAPRAGVVHEFSPTCSCCDRQVAFVVPVHWNPERIQLCSACCADWCEDHPDERSWPAAGRWTPSRIEPGEAA
jgi:hypothetical protein